MELDYGMVSTHYTVGSTDGLRPALNAAYKKNEEDFLELLNGLADFMATRLIDGYLDSGSKADKIDGEHLIITIGFKHNKVPERAEELRKKWHDLNRDTPEGEKEKTFFDVA